MEIFILLFFYIIFGAFLIKVFSKLLFFKEKETTSLFRSFVLIPFLPLKWIFKGFNDDGFMSFWDKRKLFKSSNRGFVIDGNKQRLSREASFQNILVTGSAGSGKSTVYIFSNIFTLARNWQKNSLIIADPKSDFIKKTSGYLSKHGYEVYSLNPLNLNQSIYFNPLINCKNDSDIDELARIIIESSYQGYKSDDAFWINGAISIIFCIAHSLVNTGQENITNLANVLHCLNSLSNKGKELDKLISTYASQKVYNMWLGLMNNTHENVLMSFISTAKNALVSISVNPNIERILTGNTFDFSELRNKKIALFINIAPQQAEQLAFFSNLFYTQLFNSFIALPSKKQADIFCLLDEFGQYTISSKIDIYTTFLRQSRVGFLNLIQDYKQLVHRYGVNKADVIANGGTSTHIYFSNPSIETAFDISRRIGNKKVKQKNGTYIKEEIMPLSNVLTLKKDEVLFFHASQKAAKLKVKKYFDISRFKIYSSLKPHLNTTKTNTTVSYIDLRSL